MGNSSLGYILSAALGVVIIGVIAWLFSRLLTGSRPVSSRTAPVEQE